MKCEFCNEESTGQTTNQSIDYCDDHSDKAIDLDYELTESDYDRQHDEMCALGYK